MRMHADEADIDSALVRGLLAEQFPRWADLPVHPVESSGTDNAMFRLGADLSVRLPRIEEACPALRREQYWLPRLAPSLPVAVPAPLALGMPGLGYPWDWSVQRWLDGENPVVGSIAEPTALAGDLAEFVAALRAIDPADGPLASRGVALAGRDADTCAAIGALVGTINTAAATAVWEQALRLPAWSGPPTWLHGDLSPGNVLVSAHGRLNAVIDCGGMGIGDPSVDLIVAWNLLPAPARAVFRAKLGVGEAEWQRGRGWALSIALIQLPYYRDTNPGLAANSRHVIHQVLADQRYIG